MVVPLRSPGQKPGSLHFLRLLRRYLVVIALMFWLGGFTFYASIVVPVGTRVLRSSLRQGFLTREVTHDLNLAGAGALMFLALDVLATRDPSRPRWWSRLGLLLLMVGCQVVLFLLHTELDALLRTKGLIVVDPEAFHPKHRLYLWIHTVQWLAGLLFIALMLCGWQMEDKLSVDIGKM